MQQNNSSNNPLKFFKDLAKKETTGKELLAEDIINFLDKINQKKDKSNKKSNKKETKTTDLPNINLNKSRQSLNTQGEQSNTSHAQYTNGLTDNIKDEFEYKEKARKGLLYILNKMSRGNVCPEINNYFRDKGREAEQAKMIASHKNVTEFYLQPKSSEKKKEIKKKLSSFATREFVKLKKKGSTINDLGIFKNQINAEKITFNMNTVNRRNSNNYLNEKIYTIKQFKDDLSEAELLQFYTEEIVDKIKARYFKLNKPKINKKINFLEGNNSLHLRNRRVVMDKNEVQGKSIDKPEIKGIIKNSEWNKKNLSKGNDRVQKVTTIKYDSLNKHTLTDNVKLSECQLSEEESNIHM